MNERVCIGEVGVDLELCVHAHGHDVDLIMEASPKINYPHGIRSSYIWDLILCNRDSNHDCSPLILFLGPGKVLAFCRSVRLPNLYFVLPSSITPWYLENIHPSHFIYEILTK